MTFSSSPRLVHLTMFVLLCLPLPVRAGLRVYGMRAKGLKGDFGTAPDAYVKLFVRNEYVSQTYVIKSNSNPSWSSSLTWSKAQITNSLKLQVWDKDAKKDDLLGICYAQLQRGIYTYKCTLSKGGTLTYSYEYK
ncbi:perforin-1-like [Silurus meridionalis]|uniref:C2 domain-containing protein n=1 Tax=Silurus meridionalis TaxID=175797 RepID=A0A8T0A9H8_SILME|nr:perforin-1-like [Silurus meridionalis]KAF7687683.1 hypothetical protein HF521_014911 [Silurus meridionalis]KAI5091278.1 hypothetical protein C0J45_18484 [Silurus meridionalis]